MRECVHVCILAYSPIRKYAYMHLLQTAAHMRVTAFMRAYGTRTRVYARKPTYIHLLVHALALALTCSCPYMLLLLRMLFSIRARPRRWSNMRALTPAHIRTRGRAAGSATGEHQTRGHVLRCLSPMRAAPHVICACASFLVYAFARVCMHELQRVCESASLRVCMSASLRACASASLHVCMRGCLCCVLRCV